MVDEQVIASAVSVALDNHLKQNGDKVQKNLWVRFVIQLIIVTGVVVSIYFALRADVNNNTFGIQTNCESIKGEVTRSTTVDNKRDDEMGRMKLDLNTVTIQQNAIMSQQQNMGRDIDKIDGKMDKVLERLPK